MDDRFGSAAAAHLKMSNNEVMDGAPPQRFKSQRPASETID